MIQVLPCPGAFVWEREGLLCVGGAWFDPAQRMALVRSTPPDITLLERLADDSFVVRIGDGLDLARMTAAGDLGPATDLDRHRWEYPEAGPYRLDTDAGGIVDLSTGVRLPLPAGIDGDLHLDAPAGMLYIVRDAEVVCYDLQARGVRWRGQPGGWVLGVPDGGRLLLAHGAPGRPRTELSLREAREGGLVGHRVLDHEFTPLAAHRTCTTGLARRDGHLDLETHDVASERTSAFSIGRALVQRVFPEAGLAFAYDWREGTSHTAPPDMVVGYDLARGAACFRLPLPDLELPLSMSFFRMAQGYGTVAVATTPWPDNPPSLVLWDDADVAAGGGRLVRETWCVTSRREGTQAGSRYRIAFMDAPTDFFQLLRQLGVEAGRVGQVHGYSIEVEAKSHDAAFDGHIVCDLAGHALEPLERLAIEHMCAEATQQLALRGFRAGIDPAEAIVVEARFT